MVKLSGGIEPETEDEWRLLQDLNDATREAIEIGDVSREEASRAILFLGLSLQRKDDVPEKVVVPAPDDKEPVKVEDCPECGTEIDDVRAFVGGECEVSPCGCFVHYSRLPGWTPMGTGGDE